MRLTIVHPCIGRRPGQPYIRTWQMESLPAATLAGLTPRDVERILRSSKALPEEEGAGVKTAIPFRPGRYAGTVSSS